MKKSNQVKLYNILFEEENPTSSTGNNKFDPNLITTAVKTALEQPIKTITGYLEKLTKGQPKANPSTTPATKAPSGTTPSSPSTPGAVTAAAQRNNQGNANLNDPNFIDTLVDKISQKIKR